MMSVCNESFMYELKKKVLIEILLRITEYWSSLACILDICILFIFRIYIIYILKIIIQEYTTTICFLFSMRCLEKHFFFHIIILLSYNQFRTLTFNGLKVCDAVLKLIALRTVITYAIAITSLINPIYA